MDVIYISSNNSNDQHAFDYNDNKIRSNNSDYNPNFYSNSYNSNNVNPPQNNYSKGESTKIKTKESSNNSVTKTDNICNICILKNKNCCYLNKNCNILQIKNF